MGFVPDSQGASPNSTSFLQVLGAHEELKRWVKSQRKGGTHDQASVTSAPQLFTTNLLLRHNRCRIFYVLHDYK